MTSPKLCCMLNLSSVFESGSYFAQQQRFNLRDVLQYMYFPMIVESQVSTVSEFGGAFYAVPDRRELISAVLSHESRDQVSAVSCPNSSDKQRP